MMSFHTFPYFPISFHMFPWIVSTDFGYTTLPGASPLSLAWHILIGWHGVPTPTNHGCRYPGRMQNMARNMMHFLVTFDCSPLIHTLYGWIMTCSAIDSLFKIINTEHTLLLHRHHWTSSNIHSVFRTVVKLRARLAGSSVAPNVWVRPLPASVDRSSWRYPPKHIQTYQNANFFNGSRQLYHHCESSQRHIMSTVAGLHYLVDVDWTISKLMCATCLRQYQDISGLSI